MTADRGLMTTLLGGCGTRCHALPRLAKDATISPGQAGRAGGPTVKDWGTLSAMATLQRCQLLTYVASCTWPMQRAAAIEGSHVARRVGFLVANTK